VDDDQMYVPPGPAPRSGAPLYLPIKIKLLHSSARVPEYMTHGAAGADVHACLVLSGAARFYGGETASIPLGFALEIPFGWVGLLKGRSGLAKKGHEAHVAAIDSDYRGEVCMLVHVDRELVVVHGERVGQILFLPVAFAAFSIADTLSPTTRGAGGFGSTGR